MIIIPLAFGFAVLGWIRAGKAGGKTADKAQYAAAHGLAGFILGLVITVIVDWQGWV